jgi:hypothetical protein
MGLTTRALMGWAYQSPEAITGLTKILESGNHPTQTKRIYSNGYCNNSSSGNKTILNTPVNKKEAEMGLHSFGFLFFFFISK